MAKPEESRFEYIVHFVAPFKDPRFKEPQLEDNLYLEKGVFASNGKLVEKAVKMIELLGARPVTPAEARKKLGLQAR